MPASPRAPRPTLFEGVCAAFALGAPVGAPRAVAGGLLHRVWRVATAEGAFAVKVLNAAIAQRPGARDEYRQSERIAAAMAAAGVPAVVAREAPGGPVQEIGDATVLVYDWVEGAALPPDPAPPARTRLIGGYLGRMHARRIALPGLRPPEPAAFPDEEWARLARRAAGQGLAWADDVGGALPDLSRWSALYRDAIGRLGGALVVSHRDLDQKNVLWRADGSPAIIDWEAAGLVNPTLDLAGWALDWSGQTVGPPAPETFAAFLAGYRAAGGPARDAGRDALWGCLGGWLGWLRFNLARSLGDEGADAAERALGRRETVATLATIRRYTAGLDGWAGWLDAGLRG